MLTKAQAIGIAVVVVVVTAFGGVAIATTGNDSQTCPDGQNLAAVQVNGDKFTNGELPPGASIQDTVSGSGLNYSVVSDNDSATLHVEGKGAATFRVTCR